MTTGSLINNLLGSSTNITPEVGMGATILRWSDRYAATVIKVNKSKKTITVQQDMATRTDNNGMSEDQTYTYTRDPNGLVETYTLRKNGTWVQKGTSMKDGTKLALGTRQRYYDYSF